MSERKWAVYRTESLEQGGIRELKDSHLDGTWLVLENLAEGIHLKICHP